MEYIVTENLVAPFIMHKKGGTYDQSLNNIIDIPNYYNATELEKT